MPVNAPFPEADKGGILTVLCICGIVTFLKNWINNSWCRCIYPFGGSYLLFDLFAIATGLKFGERLLLKMFNLKFGIARSMIAYAEEYCRKQYPLHKFELLTGAENTVAQTAYFPESPVQSYYRLFCSGGRNIRLPQL